MKRTVLAALGAAALALLAVTAGCTEEEELTEETPTPQPTRTATATPSRTLTPISTPTPEPTAAATPQPATATPEAPATSTPTQEPSEETPAATPTPEETRAPTPEAALEFPDIPAAPEGLSGEDSLADLMTYLDNFGSPVDSLGRVIETKDFVLSEAATPDEVRRIGFAIEIRKPGGLWLPGDEAEFEQKRDDFIRWFAERRNLSGADCRHIVFSAPLDATMLYTGVERSVRCPEGG